MHKCLILLCVFFPLLCKSQHTASETWKQTFPVNVKWKAEILNNKVEGYAPVVDVQVDVRENSIFIFDLSGGLFKQFGDSNPISIELELEKNSILPKVFKTAYGYCNVSGGGWNSETRKLTVEWKIDFNKIDEVTVLSPQL